MSTGCSSRPPTPSERTGALVAAGVAAACASTDQREAMGANEASSNSMRSSVSPPCAISGFRLMIELKSAQPHSADTRDRYPATRQPAAASWASSRSCCTSTPPLPRWRLQNCVQGARLRSRHCSGSTPALESSASALGSSQRVSAASMRPRLTRRAARLRGSAWRGEAKVVVRAAAAMWLRDSHTLCVPAELGCHDSAQLVRFH